ncbi:MAG: hypothetical protein HP496_03945 [Nitrospira sp.]|nr:hypothetical protein [Nitrospira sp.]
MDASVHGVRVGTEASTKLGDLVLFALRLPKDTVPAASALAAVRLTMGWVDGLVLKRASAVVM